MAVEGDDQADVLGQWLATRRTPGSATADTLRGRVRASGPSALESRRADAATAPEAEEVVESPYVGSRRYVEPEPVAVEPEPEPIAVEPGPEPIAVEPEPDPEPPVGEPVADEPVAVEPAAPAVPQDREHVMENLLAQLRGTPEPLSGTPPAEAPAKAEPRRPGARRMEREPRQRTEEHDRPPKQPRPAKESRPAQEAKEAQAPKSLRPEKSPKVPRSLRPEKAPKAPRSLRPEKAPKAPRPPKPEKPPRAPRARREKRSRSAAAPTSPASPLEPGNPPENQPTTAAEQPARSAREHPLAPTLNNGPITHPDVFFKPRAGAQRLAGVLLLVTLATTCFVGYAAYQDRSATNLGVLAILAILTVVIWALRITAAPATVRVVSGILEIEDGGKHYSWDLRSPHTPIEVRGRPGRGWRVWLHRPNASTYVVDSSVVSPREFMRMLRLYRPEL